jgi:hypothetical protein
VTRIVFIDVGEGSVGCGSGPPERLADLDEDRRGHDRSTDRER